MRKGKAKIDIRGIDNLELARCLYDALINSADRRERADYNDRQKAEQKIRRVSLLVKQRGYAEWWMILGLGLATASILVTHPLL